VDDGNVRAVLEFGGEVGGEVVVQLDGDQPGAGVGQVVGEGAAARADLDDGVAGEGSRASTILRWRFGSTRKFWPSRRLARMDSVPDEDGGAIVRRDVGRLVVGDLEEVVEKRSGLGVAHPDDLGQELLLSAHPRFGGECVGQAIGEEEEEVVRWSQVMLLSP
jgi:hypothetical protein